MKQNMTYKESGVNYGKMDPWKVRAQKAAQETDFCLSRFGFASVPWTRGESVFLIKIPGLGYLGFVVEGLGTKSLVADALLRLAKKMSSLTGRSYYDCIAQCNAAMAYNDLITLGALPIVYGQYLAVGNSNWFNNNQRGEDLIQGTKKACIMAGCTWGGGETPTLQGIIARGTADLAGATVGIITRDDRLINPINIAHGDAIVIFESSGIHANGLSLARRIAKKLRKGYLTKLSDGRTYGETLLDPTHIYVKIVEECQNCGVHIHYTVNITGHGWRKLMRATKPFKYVIDRLPTQLPIFDFLQKHGPVDNEEAYGNLNMGAGFALYVSEKDVNSVIVVSRSLGFRAFRAGHIEESREKKVIINPVGLEYAGNTLAVR